MDDNKTVLDLNQAEKTPLPDINPVSISNGADGSEVGEVVMTEDGTKLHPQPTADSLDPLNWSKARKHIILGIVMLKYVCDCPPSPSPSEPLKGSLRFICL